MTERPDSRIRHAPGECDVCEAERRDRRATQIQAMTIEPPAQTGETQRYAGDSTVAAAAQQESDGLSTG